MINTHLNREAGAWKQYSFDEVQNGEINIMMCVVYKLFMYITVGLTCVYGHHIVIYITT